MNFLFNHRRRMLIFLVVLTVLLSGCAYKGVDKRSFIVGIGVDPGPNSNDTFKVTLKIAKPIPLLKAETENEYVYLTHESESIAEAIRYLETENDKVMDFSQAKTMVLSEDLLDQDLFPLMDYFVRRGDLQLVLYVMAARPSAEAVLRVQPTQESAGENTLYNYFDNTGTESPFVTTTFLYEFRRDYDTKGLSAVIPIVKGNDDGTELTINQAIVLKDKVPSTTLSPTEAKLYNTLMKSSAGYGYRIEQDGYKFTLKIDRSKMKMDITDKKGAAPKAHISLKSVGSITESNKLLQLKQLDTYNKIASEKLSQQLTELFKDLQEKNLDPFGFGLKYRATRLNDSHTLDRWKEIYPDLKFDVSVDMKLKSVGSMN